MDWFEIWGMDNSTNVGKSAGLKKTATGLKVAQSGLSMIEGLSALGNNGVAKKERENEYQAIENQVLTAQDQIIENLSYNTDQAISYAARGNVAIGSSVMLEKFKKGSAEAGRDLAMLQKNAEIQKIKSDISYARKRRANTQKAINSINQFAFDLGMAGLSFGSGKAAVDPMQVASATNSL